jgi:hypothetical protein
VLVLPWYPKGGVEKSTPLFFATTEDVHSALCRREVAQKANGIARNVTGECVEIGRLIPTRENGISCLTGPCGPEARLVMTPGGRGP